MGQSGRKKKRHNPDHHPVVKPHPPKWSPEIREHVIKQLGAYRAITAIYKELTAQGFWIKHGFDGIDPTKETVQQFRVRCGNIKKTEIEKANRVWLNDWRGIPFATSKGRVLALQEMIGLLREIKENRSKFSDADEGVTITEIINAIRKLLRDIRGEMDAEAEREAKAASGTNIYIGRALSGNDITPELLNDSFIALFHEFGTAVLGLHHWTLEQLNLLKTAVIEAIESKQKIIEADFEVVEEVDQVEVETKE